MRYLIILAALASAPAAADQTLLLEPAPNSAEMTHDGERYWCVYEMHAHGLPMRCWPVPPDEQSLRCRRFPEQRAVVCQYPDGRIVTRRHGQPVVEGVVGVRL